MDKIENMLSAGSLRVSEIILEKENKEIILIFNV
jgi:hypothetical protein